jgi:hypothetical protein
MRRSLKFGVLRSFFDAGVSKKFSRQGDSSGWAITKALSSKGDIMASIYIFSATLPLG